jgi:hypothetical protein
MTNLKDAIEAAQRARPEQGAQGCREPKMRGPMLGSASVFDAFRFPSLARAPAAVSDKARRLGFAAVFLAVGVVMLALATPGPIALPLGGCRNTPGHLIFGQTFDVSMSLDRNTACSVWLHPGSAAVETLEVTSPPRHGSIGMRGRTGVIYRADRNFKGEDFFTFAMRGQSSAYRGTSVVRVRVTVR